MRRVLLTGVLGALLIPAGAEAFVNKPFMTPSKKIQCAWIGNTANSAQIRCDLFFLNDVAYVVGTKGRGHRIKISDTVGDPKGKVVAYGTQIKLGVYTCTSRTSGLTCRNRRTGHGFTVSRQRQKTF